MTPLCDKLLQITGIKIFCEIVIFSPLKLESWYNLLYYAS